MPQIVRSDVQAVPRQLTAYTTVSGDTSAARQLWAGDANKARAPVAGILIQLGPTTPDGAYIEWGGPDLTVGNGIVLVGPEASAMLPHPNAAAVWICASAAGLVVRGQIL